jgi:hypothetical protein
VETAKNRKDVREPGLQQLHHHCRARARCLRRRKRTEFELNAFHGLPLSLGAPPGAWWSATLSPRGEGEKTRPSKIFYETKAAPPNWAAAKHDFVNSGLSIARLALPRDLRRPRPCRAWRQS